MYDRDQRGVKLRYDGGGDAWAEAHRELGTSFNMQDLDALFGFVAFGVNGAEKLFLEYQPDDYKNRKQIIRRFAAVAMFDRKNSIKAAFNENNFISTANYLWQCRTFAQCQPLKPKFFYVIGSQKPPWEMIELDIDTGDSKGQHIIQTTQNEEWRALWDRIGLSSLRRALREWI